MKTLTSCSHSRILIHHFTEDRYFFLNPPEPGFLRCDNKLVAFRLFHLHRPIHPVSSVSSKSQVVIETENDKIGGPYQSKTVHVKIQLHKECSFGEQFLIVGDDPMFGLWDPSCAIPLNWSDEHVWTVELDIPTEKSIQFKFILKGSAGNILWQPGPDRGFQTWETDNTITIREDWDDAELQMITEEQVLANQSEQPFANSKELLTDAENLTLSKEELIEDNVENQKVNPILTASNNYLTEDGITYATKEYRNISDKETAFKKEVIGYNGRAPALKTMASTDTLGNLISYEGGPVLVPGLTPLSTVPTEDDKRDSVDVSVGAADIKNRSVPEFQLFKKKEHEDDDDADPHQEETIGILHDREEQLEKEIRQNPPVSKEDEHSNYKTLINNMLQRDVQWGRKTLQKLLSNLGLF